MNFHLNDKILYKGKECVVVYTNSGMAWIALWDERHVTIAKINKNGKDNEGTKVRSINPKECLEV